MDKTSFRSSITYIRDSELSCPEADIIVHKSIDSSCFAEVECGEALTAQHFIIDFTPGDLDNELVQTKCCAFWDFIRSHPDLDKFKVMPEQQQKELSDRNELDTVESSPSTPIKLGRTAVSMVELAANKGYVVPAFATTDLQPCCPFGTDQYEPCEFTLVLPSTKLEKHGCTCPGVCVVCAKTQTENEIPPPANVDSLCKKMEAWDQKNPKSMEPPGHPPSLSHCIMQRTCFTYSSK